MAKNFRYFAKVESLKISTVKNCPKMSRLIFAFNFCESLIENNEIIKNFDTCRKSIINNPKNYTGLIDFLPKMADFWPFINCQQCTGNFGPKFLVLDGHFPKNTPEFENLNRTQCLILRAAFLYKSL